MISSIYNVILFEVVQVQFQRKQIAGQDPDPDYSRVQPCDGQGKNNWIILNENAYPLFRVYF